MPSQSTVIINIYFICQWSLIHITQDYPSRSFQLDDAKILLRFFNRELNELEDRGIIVKRDPSGEYVQLVNRINDGSFQSEIDGLDERMKCLEVIELKCGTYNCRLTKEELRKKLAKEPHVLCIPSLNDDTVKIYSGERKSLDDLVRSINNQYDTIISNPREETEMDTSEGKRKTRHSFDNNLSDVSSNIKYEFQAPNGLTVKIYKGPITRLPVDAIVNAANERLANGAGVADAISQAAGSEFDKKCREFIDRNGT